MPDTVTNHIRKHLELQMYWSNLNHKPVLSDLRQTEWSDEFEQYMRNRLIMEGIRYETFEAKKQSHNYDLLGYVEDKIVEYRKTGNQECLVDAANVLMIEYECPTHPEPHFTPADDTAHVRKVE